MNRRFLEHCLQPCAAHPWRSTGRFGCTQACLDRCIGQCQTRFQGRARALQLCVNNCRGLAAELGTARASRDRRYRVRTQIPPFPTGTGVMDLTSTSPRSGRTFHYESKHLDLSRYLTPAGQLNLTALRRRLPGMIRQVRRYQAQLPQHQRVRLLVRVPYATPRAQAAALQRFLLAELTPLGIAVTVIMPGSRASRAFEI